MFRPNYFGWSFILKCFEDAAATVILSVLYFWIDEYFLGYSVYCLGAVFIGASIVRYWILKHRGVIYNDFYIGVLLCRSKHNKIFAWSSVDLAFFSVGASKLVLLANDEVMVIRLKNGLDVFLIDVVAKNVSNFEWLIKYLDDARIQELELMIKKRRKIRRARKTFRDDDDD